MKYVRNKAYENAIQKIRVEFGTLIGLETDEEAYVVLKSVNQLHCRIFNYRSYLSQPGNGSS